MEAISQIEVTFFEYASEGVVQSRERHGEQHHARSLFFTLLCVRPENELDRLEVRRALSAS